MPNKPKGAITMMNLETKIKEYRELKRMAEEAQSMADAIADELKAEMTDAGESKMIVGEYKLSYTEAKRETLDKKRLEADLGDLSEYTKTTYYKRFSVA
jgi:predicted phage-related endonuclease